jgi:hypothetical protein
MSSYPLHNATLIDGAGTATVDDAAVPADARRISGAGPGTAAPRARLSAIHIDVGGIGLIERLRGVAANRGTFTGLPL